MDQDKKMDPEELNKAVEALEKAEAILIGAGAGMGVDSGLPYFRGREGFWRAYPPFKKLNLNFENMANPQLFLRNPALAWGFYGHRLNLYRAAEPHPGFKILLDWTRKKPLGGFVYTSNVDGQFQKAGFTSQEIVEIHGSIHWLQCIQDCGIEIYPVQDLKIEVDEATMEAQKPLPACPNCGALARPNILMFGDWGWDSSRTQSQEEFYDAWVKRVAQAGARLVVVELGAGRAIPTVRRNSEARASQLEGALIRINPDENQAQAGQISLAAGAKAALEAIQARITA